VGPKEDRPAGMVSPEAGGTQPCSHRYLVKNSARAAIAGPKAKAAGGGGGQAGGRPAGGAAPPPHHPAGAHAQMLS
jgi:hypothetical protein